MTSKPKDTDTEEEIRAAFKVFDLDNNGFISTAELRQVMLSLGEKLTDAEIDLIMNEVDKDGSGTIDCQLSIQVIIYYLLGMLMSRYTLVNEFLEVLQQK